MIFLIDYHRPSGRIVSLQSFDEGHRLKAEDSRLEIELDLNRRHLDREVVLLEADNEEALRRTHRRYFEDLSELAESPGRIAK